MNDRYVCVEKNMDVDVEIDLDDIDLQTLKANVLRRMEVGNIEPIPRALLQSIGQFSLDIALVDRSYYALTDDTPAPLRELVLLLQGRVA